MNNEHKLNELLASWEDTYKKGQLTLWIFLALKEHPKFVGEIKDFVETQSLGSMTVEEQSLYRTLRKYEHIGVLKHDLRKGNKGPERKYYTLTQLGLDLFSKFVRRNIQLFFNDKIKQLLNS
jgi:DNA-binding PadR family transcriptional regulator